MTSSPTTAIGDAPTSPPVVRGPGDDHLPAYLASGVVGLRVLNPPLRGGVATLGGLAEVHPLAQVEGTGRAPYPLAGDLRMAGIRLSDFPGQVRGAQQHYDFASGELTSRFRFVGAEATAEVEVVTFCSRTHPSVVAQQVEVTVDRACDLEVSARVDTNEVPGRVVSRFNRPPADERGEVVGGLHWETNGGMMSCGVAVATTFSDPDAERLTADRDTDARVVITHRCQARARTRYRMVQVAAMVPSGVHSQPDLQAARLATNAARLGFDELREQNRAEWSRLWRSRILLHGADRRWQDLADAAFFYVNTSVHSSSLASTHIFGLSRWYDYHYYYGHVMWDIEAFAVPALLLTQPHAARALLDFRSRTSYAARLNAQLNGYRGLQYPWQAAPRKGQEATPGAGDGAATQHHISANVAIAFAKYVEATGDTEFDRVDAWPVLKGVADWIESRVAESPRGYEILRADGIAERQQVSDNSAYVNMTAQLALRHAIACGERNGFRVPDQWRRIDRGLYLPTDDTGKVIVDHEDFQATEEKAATPAALAALFPAGYQVDPAVERATIEHYLDVADDYIGSPMLSALYPTWASWIGDRKRALRLLDEGYAAFTSPRFMDVHEYDPAKFPDEPVSGPFMANMAGFLLTLCYGFTGLRSSMDDPTMWPERPVCLPQGWDAIEINALHVRDRTAHLRAEHGANAAELTYD
jgi:trehalose/maltose hydrolase-like predicted phosphorylase